jgi:MFS family permease
VTVPTALTLLTRDAWLLFATRFIRLFAYGSLSVVLVFYLIGLGLSESQTGMLLTLTLMGDTLVSLYLTTRADRIGRRRMLIVGAALMAGAGLVFAFTRHLWLLMLAGTIGVISPSGGEVGPFLSIEQAALAHVVTDRTRTEVFAWYTLAGSLATALGALAGGTVTYALQKTAMTPVTSYRAVVILYAALGVMLAFLFARLSAAAEASTLGESARLTGLRSFGTLFGLWGIERSRHVVFKLSSLFALDAFGGGFVVQSFAAYWFYLRFGVNPGTLGAIFFWANIFAGISALLASRLASRFGLINTMVATHLPSNVLLILVPLMPTLPLAVLVLLVRFSISQMDVPTRQSYIMAVVSPEERSAAAGITGVARTIGASVSPLFVGLMFARPALINLPFFIAGTLKIVYDVLLYKEFVAVQPPEELRPSPGSNRSSP